MTPSPLWTPPVVSVLAPDTARWEDIEINAETAYKRGFWSAALTLDTTTGVLSAEFNRGQHPRINTTIEWDPDTDELTHRDPDTDLIATSRETGGDCGGWRHLAITALAGPVSYDRIVTVLTHATPIAQQMVDALRPLPGDTTWDWTKPAAEQNMRLHQLLKHSNSDDEIARIVSNSDHGCDWMVDMEEILTHLPQIANPEWVAADDVTLDREARWMRFSRSQRFWLYHEAIEDSFGRPITDSGLAIIGARSALRKWRDTHDTTIVPVGAAAPTHGPVLACWHHHNDHDGQTVSVEVEASCDDAKAVYYDRFDGGHLSVLEFDGVARSSMLRYEATRFLAALHKRGYTARLREEPSLTPSS